MIEACALKTDLEILDDGDETEIGEKVSYSILEYYKWGWYLNQANLKENQIKKIYVDVIAGYQNMLYRNSGREFKLSCMAVDIWMVT